MLHIIIIIIKGQAIIQWIEDNNHQEVYSLFQVRNQIKWSS